MIDNDSIDSLSSGSFVGGKFKLEDKIGQGSFGMIFKALNIETKQECALKLEKKAKHNTMLIRELKVLLEMKDKAGFARLFGYGKEENFYYVAMTYLGRNLDNLLRKCGGKFSMACVINIFEQCLTRLEDLHSKNLIHRDIKPENFVIGQGQLYREIYLIDFGLAKFYLDTKTKQHIPFYEKKGMIGTARYASINAHKGYEQSRRDDLEGLGYMMVYFAKSRLPWQGIYADCKDDKYDKIKNMKLSHPPDILCDGLPKEFSSYFEHVKNLKFEQEPDYKYLRGLLQKIAHDKNLDYKEAIDWEILPEYRSKKNIQVKKLQENCEVEKIEESNSKIPKVSDRQERPQPSNSKEIQKNSPVKQAEKSQKQIQVSGNISQGVNLSQTLNQSQLPTSTQLQTQTQDLSHVLPLQGIKKSDSINKIDDNQKQKKVTSMQNLLSKNQQPQIQDRESSNRSKEKTRDRALESKEHQLNIQQIQIQKNQKDNQQQIVTVEEYKRQNSQQKRLSIGSNFLVVPTKDGSSQNPTCNFTYATSRINNYGTSNENEQQDSQQIDGMHLNSFQDSQIKFITASNVENNFNIQQEECFNNYEKLPEDEIVYDKKKKKDYQKISPDIQSSHMDYHKKYPIHVMKCKKAYNMQL